VNYRTKELTAAAARSLLAEPELAELVVVDNASDDGSADYLRRALDDARVQVVESSENLGFGQGVNLGAARTTAPLLMLLNSDAELVAGSLGRLADELRAAPRLGVAAPLILGHDGRAQVDAFGVFPSYAAFALRTNRRPPDRLEPDWVSGVAMAVRRTAFDEVGGFDPAFWMYLEDVDLCRRLSDAGWGIRRCTSAVVLHLGQASAWSSAQRERQYHDSLLVYLERGSYPHWQVRGFGLAHRGWQRWRHRAGQA